MKNFVLFFNSLNPTTKNEKYTDVKLKSDNLLVQIKTFRECKFEGSFLSTVHSGTIVFENCIFSDPNENAEFDFSDKSTLVFKNCQFKGGLVFSKIHTVLLTNNTIEGRLVFEESSYENVDILNVEEKNYMNRINHIQFKIPVIRV